MSIHTAADLDREFRSAIAHGAATTDEVRMARALFDAHALELVAHNVPRSVSHALGAAARLIDGGKVVSPSQVRRLYGNGGQMFDLVCEAVTAAA